MKITSVKAIPYRIPYKIPVKWASGFLDAAEHALVLVSMDEGITGIGEAIPRPTIYGETLPSIIHIINKHLGPQIIGMDPFDIEKIWLKLKHIKVNYCAKAGLDVALHDLIGKFLNVPLYKLFGGSNKFIPLTHRVATSTLENMANECKQFTKNGFKSFKIKIGVDIKKDIDLVRTIREAIGPDFDLYADANGNYNYETAVKILPKMEDYNLKFIEEPLPSWNKRGRLKLSHKIDIPILADDSAFTPEDVFEEILMGAIGAISVKIPRTGFYLSRKIIHLAEQADLPVVVGTQAETALGAAASLQVALSYRQVCIPSEITAHLNVVDKIINEDILMKNGCLYPNNNPGIGVTIDEDKLEFYRIKEFGKYI
jgi:L-alanine-DL-glutamate epimerase-like enolase superfamily enzyme